MASNLGTRYPYIVVDASGEQYPDGEFLYAQKAVEYGWKLRKDGITGFHIQKAQDGEYVTSVLLDQRVAEGKKIKGRENSQPRQINRELKTALAALAQAAQLASANEQAQGVTDDDRIDLANKYSRVDELMNMTKM